MIHETPKRVTVPSILHRKQEITSGKGAKLTALTAYDYSFAKLIDQAGIDIILVGDSLGSVIQGGENTIPVTMDQMVYHCRCVSRGVERALVVGDLPFMSYQVSPERALESAGRLLKEGGVQAVKLEGGLPMAETIRRIAEVDIPVMGHVGLTPQSYHRMGGHKTQGKSSSKGAQFAAGTRERILADAKIVEESGAFCLVIEGVPDALAQEITELVSIPTIGIGAGPACDGQILVSYDMLGLDPEFKPSFVKHYASLGKAVTGAVGEYISEVKSGAFPLDDSASRRKLLKA